MYVLDQILRVVSDLTVLLKLALETSLPRISCSCRIQNVHLLIHLGRPRRRYETSSADPRRLYFRYY